MMLRSLAATVRSRGIMIDERCAEFVKTELAA